MRPAHIGSVVARADHGLGNPPEVTPPGGNLPYGDRMVGRSRAALAAAVLVTLALPVAAYASPTDPDQGFGNDGVLVITHSGSLSEYLVDMEALPNGKTLLLMDTFGQPRFEVHRLLKDGRPDLSYGGGDGIASFGRSSSYEDTRLAADPTSGKVYVSGFVDNGTTSPTTVWRLKANGKLDKAYGGGDGHAIFNKRIVYDLLPLPRGKLLMAGDDFAVHHAEVWQLTGQGTPDRSYGSHGQAVLSKNVNDSATSLVRQPDGKIVVAGWHYDPMTSTLMAFRLKGGGARDRTFGDRGKIQVSPSSAGVTTSTVWSPQVLLRPDGRTVYVAGLNQNNGSFFNSLLVVGLTAKGGLDHKVGEHVYPSISETDSSSALERDGKLVVAGYLPLAPSNDAIFRFTKRGVLDRSWSGDGTLPITASVDNPQAVITPRGRVLIGQSFGSAPYDATVSALQGTRTPTCHGKLATQFGGNKADTITGTPGADVLVGLGGKDTLKGLGGNDVLCGSASADRLYGGPGNDALYGGPGHDKLVGGPGHNTLVP